ncbi:3280_t:CDS:1, partial [Gigaspora margarita]
MDNSLPNLQETITSLRELLIALVHTSDNQRNACLISLASASITSKPERTTNNNTNNKQDYLNYSSTFTSHTDFVLAVQEYAIQQ